MELRFTKLPFLAGLPIVAIVCNALAQLILRSSLLGQIGGSLGILVICAVVVRALTRVFSCKPAVVIDHIGIEDTRSGIGIIPWDEITSVHFKNSLYHRWLCIEVAEPQKYLAILPSWRIHILALRQEPGVPPLSIPLDLLRPKPRKLRHYLEEHHPNLLRERETA